MINKKILWKFIDSLDIQIETINEGFLVIYSNIPIYVKKESLVTDKCYALLNSYHEYFDTISLRVHIQKILKQFLKDNYTEIYIGQLEQQMDIDNYKLLFKIK